ncbi:hypothetical protein FHG64_15525 [Antarcticibacterium flavum]|uniref:Bacterial Pleckstrin homology domain-containing protein n=1 Tax=Antarcticibacterium flavum TaxID=2058175 RepID=A0A5B7X5N0_9FLAO|nr:MULTISPECIES: PH domain-containing protein [Antarcticibacterium]MCM4159755.1 hypothetical protein [Antarcticibacterium sp. W02-3]QCY70687.1 hypothetical protein FHG64_15525 [Antarcticibacterium flavum]
MRVFEERQQFNQWWLYAILGAVLVIILLAIYKNTDGFMDFNNPLLILGLLAATLPIALVLWMQLKTRIDREGIKVVYLPFGSSKKFFPWEEIEECYVRKYNPLLEYGGWGMRGIGNKKAYNASGNLGIQIVTRDKKNFLIGTQQPGEARAVIKNYIHKINTQSNKY